MKKLHDKKYTILASLSKYIFIFIIAFAIAIPVLAVPPPPQQPVVCTGFDTVTKQPTPTGCDPTLRPDSGNTTPGVKVSTGITNPIAGIEDIPSLIEAILNFALIVGVPIVTLAIIYCGFLFVTAQGNSEKLGKAKKALLYTLIGAALLLGSYVIAKAIQGTVDDIKSTT